MILYFNWDLVSEFFYHDVVRQEAAALAATQVAYVLQHGQRRGLQFAIASGPTVTPRQEPV